ncbi:AraC family transcriptional regulator [Paraburkholderia antibiotica]|uniref:AraC family transcriptional regulator n=1 Tax=Paraburkholderia antibiotica TaxID=2728839 RepID=A0A7Y0A253_9BURK|nr:GyrI-like domain-containing protein [Paraburkholderia antibiotica]NML35053.1 AraC family transcriptional regulator [Paraburkholderia antibiotica]
MKPSTERDYRRRIARVIEAILVDPGAPHTLDSLAAVAHLSPYHFHRIYRALMGESVVETVKRLRLAQAAQRLTDAAQVTAVAHDAGYDSPQAFARAFRDFTGVSPSEFRARQRLLVGHPLVGAASVRSPTAGSAGSAACDAARRQAVRMNGATQYEGTGEGSASDSRPNVDETAATAASCVEVVELPPLDVLCLHHDGPVATIGQTFRTLMTTLRCEQTPLAPQRIGICARDAATGGFRYRAGVVAGWGDETARVESPEHIEPLRLEGGLYAVHRLIGPYALISPTFRALNSGWLPRSGYRRDRRPALELYRSSPDPGAQPTCITDLLIPIRED